MTDFIRETFPFLYSISTLKLLGGMIIAIFIFFLIQGEELGEAAQATSGVLFLGAIVYGLAYFFLDGFAFADAIAIGLLATIVIVSLGIIIAITKKAKRKAKRKAEVARERAEVARERAEEAERERQAKICPQCGAENAVVRLKDEDVWKPYVFKGFKTIKGRRMEYYQRTVDRIKGCNQCDYRTIEKTNTYDYDVKEMADDEGFCCPKCDARDSVYLKEVVMKDRFASNKEVEETTSRGKKTRYIKVMKLIEEETYACKNCDFTSVATVTKELG